jgi:hypothetical protein
MSDKTFTDKTPVSKWGIIMRDEMFELYYSEIVRIRKKGDSDIRDDIRCSACDKAMWDLSRDIMMYGEYKNKEIMKNEAHKYGYKWCVSSEKWVV